MSSEQDDVTQAAALPAPTYLNACQATLGFRIYGNVVLHIPRHYLSSAEGITALTHWLRTSVQTRIFP